MKMCSVTDPPRIVFYRTLAIDPASRLGSSVRPARLLEAFRKIGCTVDVVAGPAAERKRSMEEVRRRIAAGQKYEFLYAEPPTTPVVLNESHHLPTHPLMDYQFLGHCHSSGIPVMLFYSDVQWRLPDYPHRIGWPKYLAALPFFHLDLAVYSRVVDAFLVPANEMAAVIAPWVKDRPHWASIPGYDPEEQLPPREPAPDGSPLRLFYVGGVQPPVYDLHALLRGSAAAAARGIRHTLTICCREPEWARRPSTYDEYMGSHVQVVHNRTRWELLELYVRHDVAVMPYGTLNSDWAMPVKFPEAIGVGAPVLAGSETAVGRVVEQQRIGWTVDTSSEAFSALLGRIEGPEVERARRAVIEVRPSYAWTERAREIVGIGRGLRR